MKVLILATSKTSKAVIRIRYEAIKRGHTVLIVHPMDLFLLISSSESGYDRLYHVENGKVSRINIKDFSAVIVRLGEMVGNGSFLVEHLNMNLKLFSTISAEGIRTTSNQLKTLQILSSNGIATPRTVFAQNANHIEHLIEKVGGYPVICKITQGSSGGNGVSLLKDKKTAIPILQSLFKSRSSVILQEYLPSGGKDCRVLVLGQSTVIASMERSAAKNDFRANLKQHANAKPIELDEHDKQLCINAARALNIGAVGLDLIKHNGRTYVIEANANFGWNIEKITRLNIAEMMVQYCEQNYQNKNMEKAQVLSFQKQLQNELMQTEALSQHIEVLNDRLKYFTEDKYIREVYQKAKGKTVSYQDRNRNKKKVKVEYLKDVYQIILDSFEIK